ncbi:MAG TPA: LUD domain-containing protein [Planctomycetota bacterium]|nr:LUD domain-containing protein [Planctomycetota bacterium]
MTTPRAELVTEFCSELAKIGGAARVARSKAELEELLVDFLKTSGARQLVGFSQREFEPFELSRALHELPITAWEPGTEEYARCFRAQAAAADIGLTVADLAVAATGSLLFRADARRPRSVSLLPRSHVAMLHARQLVPALVHALDWLARQGAPPSSALFVTGPSRTSDIENDLTLGVHGPAAVTVFLLDD